VKICEGYCVQCLKLVHIFTQKCAVIIWPSSWLTVTVWFTDMTVIMVYLPHWYNYEVLFRVVISFILLPPFQMKFSFNTENPYNWCWLVLKFKLYSDTSHWWLIMSVVSHVMRYLVLMHHRECDKEPKVRQFKTSCDNFSNFVTTGVTSLRKWWKYVHCYVMEVKKFLEMFVTHETNYSVFWRSLNDLKVK